MGSTAAVRAQLQREYASDNTFTLRVKSEPAHSVRLTNGFYLGVHEVTQEQYQEVMGTNPANFAEQGASAPVEQVSWLDAVLFCNRLSEREGLQPYYEADGTLRTGGANGYRLPTEAQWEYSARAGTSTLWYFGDDPALLAAHAWTHEIAGGKTHPVGIKRPNAFGIYDIYGNVSEWWQDAYQSDYYEESPALDAPGPTGSNVVFRGGGWGLSGK